MEEKKQKGLLTLLTGLLLAVTVFAGNRAAKYADVALTMAQDGGKEGEEKKYCVVLDAGHGGKDPGKVGVNGALEKDINLEIAQLVRTYLEQGDVTVVMTRESDEEFCDPDSTNKKVQDMKHRISVIDKTKPDITVSIHQNSFPDASVRGAQVFYYSGSTQGQSLAQKIQKSLTERTDPQNCRQIKANSSYYLLKKTDSPIVIVECGFLSNAQEAEKLCDKDYQKRIAWAVYMGILQYLNDNI